MPARKLIVLRAGAPPVRGDKVVYWRERAFTRRVAPPPVVPAYGGFNQSQPNASAPSVTPSASQRANDPLTLDLVIPMLDAAGLEPLPEHGASDEAVEAWVERFIDASARPALQETNYAR